MMAGVVEPMQVDLEEHEALEGAEESKFQVDNPTVDLETYASQYTGYAKYVRLRFIASHCPMLAVEALRLALTHTQSTFDTKAYAQTHNALVTAAKRTPHSASRIQSLPDAVSVSSVPSFDTAWVEKTQKRAMLKLEKLDTDLKNYKSNSIKESIRRGHDDLGEHYLDCGDLSNALKCFSRARDYCTSPKHVVSMCLNVIQVSIYLQNWTHVLSYGNKAEATPELSEPAQKDSLINQQLTIKTKLKCSAGLADLSNMKYKAAAKCFLQASFDHCQYSEVLSPNNVAYYGALCALASFDRSELHKNVLSSSQFKQFLELEPQLRDALNLFYDSKYAQCLTLLDEMRDNFMLDIYLARHIPSLYSQIRNKALCQYFSPYLSADMSTMALSFNTTVPRLEEELMALILEGQIKARIDSHNKVLYAKDIDQRSSTFEKALSLARSFQRRTAALILRSAMIRAGIQVKAPQPRDQEPTSTSVKT